MPPTFYNAARERKKLYRTTMKISRLRKFTDKDTHTVIDPVKGTKGNETTMSNIIKVNNMFRLGYTQEEICNKLGLSQRTLWRRYYGYSDMHRLTSKEQAMPKGEYVGPVVVDGPKYDSKAYYPTKGKYYPVGYVRMHIGACCTLNNK